VLFLSSVVVELKLLSKLQVLRLASDIVTDGTGLKVKLMEVLCFASEFLADGAELKFKIVDVLRFSSDFLADGSVTGLATELKLKID
jgi:hypothetical protein